MEETTGDLDQEVKGLTYDSRKARTGQVFFALPGEKVDGHDFIGAAVRQGASALVFSRQGNWPRAAATVRVKDSRRAMGLWAAHFFARPSAQLKLAGVTGTNGKTTLSYLIESIFQAAALEPGVIGTINYRFRGNVIPSHQTTPESIDLEALLDKMRRSGVGAVAMEVSSHALVQERVRGLDFDVGVFTNLSRDHLDYHRDMDDYFQAKSKLFTDYLRVSQKPNKAAVIYGDDPRGPELMALARAAGLAVWSYGESPRCDIHPLDVERDVRGLRGSIQAKERIVKFSSPLIGAANLQNIMGAIGVGLALGLEAQTVVQGIDQLQSVPGRLEKVANDSGITILVDYAHTPDALAKVLGAMRPLTQKRLITVFGCGGDRDRGKRPLMGEIAAHLSDVVVITSDNPRTETPETILSEIEAGIGQTKLNKVIEQTQLQNNSGYWVEADRRKAIRVALAVAAPGDAVLIAGKGHEDYQILGETRIHFDDREVAREEAARRAGG
ncbi:MAG: UDP-N-acetylmuramoyl-L-alanyl-D-glutamate--2,6-diaminopimelate ligase [Candidatus Binatia bacterium]